MPKALQDLTLWALWARGWLIIICHCSEHNPSVFRKVRRKQEQKHCLAQFYAAVRREPNDPMEKIFLLQSKKAKRRTFFVWMLKSTVPVSGLFLELSITILV